MTALTRKQKEILDFLLNNSKARLNSGQKAFEFRTGNNRIFGLKIGRRIFTANCE